MQYIILCSRVPVVVSAATAAVQQNTTDAVFAVIVAAGLMNIYTSSI